MADTAIPTALAIGTTVGTIALLHAERARSVPLRRTAKCMASLCFVLLGMARCSAARPEAATWMVGGLVLGALGDVVLLGRGDAAFLGGLGAFLLGHLAYVVAFAALAEPHSWLSLPALPVAAFGA